ncbi:ABC-type metal ion transport system periplasmic component/surface adhesin [Vibrio maritimus]|uniref:ABC-type metal ion transport system periplasmic component/surface adhesin n=1 Tax=Vibrio maritimus TaxID=990268 RepID=A0A090SDA6_9VIBR|nr:ABC-type metal ion transport system periplasmic component/surface adhesin [Vibrio maritimus]
MRLLSMVKYLKSKLLIVSLCLGALLGNNFVFANDILTSSPVTYALSTSLAKHTPITTAYLPPKRYSMDRLPNWFRTKGAALSAMLQQMQLLLSH